LGVLNFDAMFIFKKFSVLVQRHNTMMTIMVKCVTDCYAMNSSMGDVLAAYAGIRSITTSGVFHTLQYRGLRS